MICTRPSSSTWLRLLFTAAVFACLCFAACAKAEDALPVSPQATFPLPATQSFPTPQPSPTAWQTPELPQPVAIDVETGIRYTSKQRLDVYAPVLSKSWPVIVFLHGGRVDKESARSLGMALAGQGSVVFIPEYQSYEPPADRITKGPEDAACALRFAKAQAVDFGGDRSRVVLVGHSAGGAFGALVALAGDEFKGDCLVTEGSALPDLFIGLDGAYDILRYWPETRLREAPAEDWLRISPYAAIGRVPVRRDLSFHLFVGLETELLQDAQAFRDTLHGAGYQVSLTLFPGIDHMYIASGNHANTVRAISTLVQP